MARTPRCGQPRLAPGGSQQGDVAAAAGTRSAAAHAGSSGVAGAWRGVPGWVGLVVLCASVPAARVPPAYCNTTDTNSQPSARSRLITLLIINPQSVGSMLIAATAEESEGLRLRQALLAAAGLEARLLSADDARQLEPALQLVHSAMLVPTDAQVNGKATAAALQQACEAHGGRFTTLFNEGAQALVFSPSGRAKGVRTEARRCVAFG